MKRARRRAGGFQLLEILVSLAIVLVVSTLTLPELFRLSAGLRVRLAARELAGALRTARSLAVRHNARVAVRFRRQEAERTTWTIYRDGDGDGVLNRDIDSGVDPPLAPARRLFHLGRHVRFGIPEGPPPRDPGDPRRRLGKLRDPVRFNRSDLASFSPLGGSTPGSLYLTDGERLAVVRLCGRTGKVKILYYDRRTETWR